LKGVWQLPVLERRTINEQYIKHNAKYHYYEYEEPRDISISPLGKSLCNKHVQQVEDFESIKGGEILSNPHIACKRCRDKWRKLFNL
jgi:hypothetical protein